VYTLFGPSTPHKFLKISAKELKADRGTGIILQRSIFEDRRQMQISDIQKLTALVLVHFLLPITHDHRLRELQKEVYSVTVLA
jgi:hypothetical protein